MFRIFSIIAAVFLTSHTASAEAVWANYSFNVKPGAEAKLEKAMRGYIRGNTEFTGKIFFNRQIMNGSNSATHNVALLAPNMSEWEKGLARNQTDPNFQAVALIFAQNAVRVDESLMTHVRGYGEIKGEGAKFMTYALSVSSPVRLVQVLDKAFSKEGSWTLSGPLDLFAVTAGGAPGITHIVVIGTEDFATFQSYLRSENFLDMSRDLDRVRKIQAVGMVENIIFQGPFDLNTLR